MGKYDKEHKEKVQEYLYDAFISYRHMPLDKAVAERLQELLENFRFQKNSRKLHIFRDKSELTTGNDLGSEIRKALLQSRYLIVVCSEHTKESIWCMEEIRQFKEAHQGSTRHILTLIVSGEPEQVLPEPLRWEERPVSLAAGRTALQREIIEPLSADVRAATRRKSLRILRTEFLRIAAPILDCGFDELFQRRQRRQRRNTIIIFTGALTLLAVVLIVVSVFAYRTKISEANYRNILVDNYTKEGNRYANSGKPQEALLYYTQALSLNPEKTSAASGAALLLQEYLWPTFKETRPAPYPDEISPEYTTDPLFSDYGPNALAFTEDKIIAAQNGIIHVYTLDEQGTAVETAQADLAEAFPADAAQNGISQQNNIYLSRDGSLALISTYSHAALYDTENLSLKAVAPKYFDGLTGMDISTDNQYFALSYGNPYRINLLNPGGCFDVYSQNGELLFSSPQTEKDALLGAAFNPADPEQLLVWGADFVRLWNWKEGREIMAPIRENDITSVCFTGENTLLVDNKSQTSSSYTLTEIFPSNNTLKEDIDDLPFIHQYYMDAAGPNGMTLSLSVSELTLTDKEGKVLNTVSLPAMGQRVALSGDFRTAYLYNQNYPALMSVPVDFTSGTFGAIHEINTNGEATLGIWFGDEFLAAETTSRNLLLFDKNGRQVCKIMPQNNGNIVSILTDSDMRYVVCILENTISNPRDYHYDKTGIIEIWDTSSRLLLSSFQKDGLEIDKACITGDGTLFWSVNGETCARQLSIPVPDKETIQFLQELCSLSLDANQEFTLKKPSISDLQMVSWSVLEAGTKLMQNSDSSPDEPDSGLSEQTFIHLVKELYSAENTGDDIWFKQCDALWERLLKDELDYTAPELDTFYQAFHDMADLNAAAKTESPADTDFDN